jgi:hypothetical protein
MSISIIVAADVATDGSLKKSWITEAVMVVKDGRQPAFSQRGGFWPTIVDPTGTALAMKDCPDDSKDDLKLPH